MSDIGTLLLTHPAWGWVAVAAIFLTVELVTGSGWLLWPAGAAALVALAVLIVPLSFPGAVVLFAVLTIITTYLGRRYMPKSLASGADVNDPLARIVGHHGKVAAAFQAGLGRVFVDGKEWAAEAEDEGGLAVGETVEVIAVVGGARLKVRAG